MQTTRLALLLVFTAGVLGLSVTASAKPPKKVDATFKLACDQAGGRIIEVKDPDTGAIMKIVCCYWDEAAFKEKCVSQSEFKGGSISAPAQALPPPSSPTPIKPMAAPPAQLRKE
jgi:hypothetical protein